MNVDLTPDLQAALAAELARLRDTDVGRRMAAIEVLLSEDGYAPAAPSSPSRQQGRRGPGVSEVKLNAVRQYLQTKGEARQVQISTDLDENSGTVSLALRALETEGVALDTGRVVNKSKIWQWAAEPIEETLKGAGGRKIDLGTAGRTSAGDRDAKHIAENLKYTTEEPQ